MKSGSKWYYGRLISFREGVKAIADGEKVECLFPWGPADDDAGAYGEVYEVVSNTHGIRVVLRAEWSAELGIAEGDVRVMIWVSNPGKVSRRDEEGFLSEVAESLVEAGLKLVK